MHICVKKISESFPDFSKNINFNANSPNQNPDILIGVILYFFEFLKKDTCLLMLQIHISSCFLIIILTMYLHTSDVTGFKKPGSGPVRVLDSQGQVFAGFLETRYITST